MTTWYYSVAQLTLHA